MNFVFDPVALIAYPVFICEYSRIFQCDISCFIRRMPTNREEITRYMYSLSFIHEN